jgi:hypothetical protein
MRETRLFAWVMGAALASWVAAAPARGAFVGEVEPTASVGATSNAQALSTGEASAFSTVTALGRVRVESQRATLSVGNRVGFTHYFVGTQDALSDELLATSTIEIARPLVLSLHAGAALSRTSNVTTTSAPGQAALPGSRLYLASSAGEELAYSVTDRLRLSQQFNVARVDYPSSSAGAAIGRPSTALTAGVHAEDAWARDTISLDASGTDLLAEAGVDPLGMMVPAGTTRFATGMAGWRRELSLNWGAQLQGGAAWLQQPSGQAVWLPAVIAAVGYRHLPWFATLTLQHAPTANLFLGVATINDQALLNLTLPLDRGELVVLSGFTSYARARVALAATGTAAPYDYDQAAVGSTLSVRFRTLPLFGSLTYSLIDQRGTTATSGEALDIIRHTLMLNVTAIFQWGPAAATQVAGGLT